MQMSPTRTDPKNQPLPREPQNPELVPQGTDLILCSQAQNRASQLEGRESSSDPFGHVFLLRYHLR